MFLAVVVYPKLPSEMSVRSNVVLVWGAVLRMKPLCSLRSAAGPGAPRPAAGTVCLRAPALLLGMLRGWNGSRKGGKSSASLCNKEFIRLYFNKIKLLRNEREWLTATIMWSFALCICILGLEMRKINGIKRKEEMLTRVRTILYLEICAGESRTEQINDNWDIWKNSRMWTG